MPIDSITVGGKERTATCTGDPTNASNLQSVLTPGDAQALVGLYASLTGGFNWLLNAAGTYDRQRSAIGATGVTAVSTESAKTTYSNGIIGFVPAATPTDFWQIIGSATKTVRVLRISISGFATAAISEDIQLWKRTTASTGGTPTAPLIAKHDSNDAAATAVVNSFGTVPTPLGTTAGILRAAKLNLGATGAAGVITWDFTTRNSKGLVLRGVAEQLALNWNGAAVPAGTLLDIDVEFTEE